VPRDILAAVGSSPEEFVAGDSGLGAPQAVAAMVALANEHLDVFEQEAFKLPQTLRPAFLPLALTRAYLKRLNRPGFEPLRQIAELSAWRRQWLLLRRASRGWPARSSLT
jgi:phytoene synthase